MKKISLQNERERERKGRSVFCPKKRKITRFWGGKVEKKKKRKVRKERGGVEREGRKIMGPLVATELS